MQSLDEPLREKTPKKQHSVKSNVTNGVHSVHSNYTYVREMDINEDNRSVRQASDEAMSALKFALKVQKERLGAAHPGVATTLSALGKGHYKRREYIQAMEAYEESLASRRERARQNGIDPILSSDVADTLNRMGNVRYQQYVDMKKDGAVLGYTCSGPSIAIHSYLEQALNYYTLALKSRQSIRAKNENSSSISDEEAYLMENIGNVLFQRCKYSDALEQYSGAMDVHSKSSSRNCKAALAFSLTCLGDTHKEMSKKDENPAGLQTSLDFYRRAMQMRLKHGKERIELASILDRVGEVHFLMEAYGDSLESYNAALSLKRKLLGETHIFCSISLKGVALAQIHLDKKNEALESYEDCLKIEKLRLKKRELDFAIIAKDIDAIHEDEKQQFTVISGEYETSMSDLVRAYCSVADILGCITNIYQTQGDLNNALQTTKEEVMYLKIPLGNNNPDLAPAMEKIAVLQFKNSKFNDALCSFKEVLRMRKAKFGQDHLTVATTNNNIGNVLNAMANYQEALEYYQRAMEAMKIMNASSFQIATVIDNMASCHTKLKNFDEAEKLYQDGLQVKREMLEQDKNQNETRSIRIEIANSLKCLGILFYQRRQLKMSIKILNEALEEKRLASAGRRHIEDFMDAEIYFRLGTVYYSERRYTEAKENYEKCLKIKRCIEGDCSEVLDILNMLARIYRAQGNKDLANAIKKEINRLAPDLSTDDPPEIA